MSRAIAVFAELPVALIGIFAAIWSWNHGVRTTSFGPAIDGAPATAGTLYDGSWIALAFLLVTIAAVLLVDTARRLAPHGEPA
ncbi:hypothetical protein [Antrihabitans cavernicola]|uniref:Uncharacterized protein n=1 Tax=Antrihabitans cavernicola TaxID=2495913 RepID=A0A5A7S898_9NOCA|nr:hypothetical protein [Spelaeibacter cavernicola]KAA0022360.1 hypothetical protein FOY51_15450 [Spelaeibacter cavernicola]